MRNVFIGFVLGVAVSGVVVWLVVVPHVRESYRAVGYNDGLVSARSDLADKITQTLGTDLRPSEPREVLYDVKATSVVVVERNSVKTLRVDR